MMLDPETAFLKQYISICKLLAQWPHLLKCAKQFAKYYKYAS